MELLQLVPIEWWQQLSVIVVLGSSLIFFIRDRWRYDAIALFVMIVIMVLGILPYDTVLANFGHPVVVIVGCMFIISQALVKSGFIDAIVTRLPFLYTRPLLSLFFLIFIVTILSGFINNIGALAMVIPIALTIAKKNHVPVSFFLLPLAFASHLGGYLTLIGTPRNILISDYRMTATGSPFEMFDFLPVGIVIALMGILFIFLYSWRFLPRKLPINQDGNMDRVFVTEVQVNEKSKLLDNPVSTIKHKMKGFISLLHVFRNNEIMYFEDNSLIHEGDIIQISGTEDDLTNFIEKNKLQLTGHRSVERYVTNNDDYTTLEVVIPSYAGLSGMTWDEVSWPDRFGTNFIGLFRKNFRDHILLSKTKLIGNDIILLQGRRDSLLATVEKLGLIPIADSDVSLGRKQTASLTALIVVFAIFIASINFAPLPIVFLCAVAVLVGSGLVSLKQAYSSIEWPVLILLAGMITLGSALEVSGAVDSLANFLLLISDYLSPVWILFSILFVSMLLSDFINTTAAAVIMAPISIIIANTIGVSVDPFLMAVAVGVSSAFLTPVGHESNAFVMQKGGYRFSDFTKMGLPVELIIMVISIPMILYVWPL